MKKVSILFLTILLAACASTKLLSPAQTDVDRVATKYPDYSLEELNHGKTLYTQHCGNCHGLKNPAGRGEEQWKKVVPRMMVKVNKKEGNILDAKAEESILRYLITMSTASPTK